MNGVTVWNTVKDGPLWFTLLLCLIVFAVLAYYLVNKDQPRRARAKLRRRHKKRTYNPRDPDDCMEYISKYGEPLRHPTTKKE